MAQEQARQLLQRGIAAAQAGQKDTARQALQQAIRLDPQNETAWLWLSSVARDDQERIFCLKRLITINPHNEHAIKGLQRLGIEPSGPVSTAPSSPVPSITDDKYARLQQATDEFLRRYNPQPVDHLGVEWAHKPKKRYGEGGARRLQRIAYTAAALVVVIAVGAVIAVLANVDILPQQGDEVALATRIPSLTPTLTLTPTQGGPTPTPFPSQMAVPPTEEPQDLEPGDPFRLASPTAIYPRIDSVQFRTIEEAIDQYSAGNYARAAESLDDERVRSEPYCYAHVVYYEALSNAGQEKYNEALSLLQQALAYEPPRGYSASTCQNSPLLLTGLGYVSYLQDHQSQAALNYSEQALGMDPKIALASETKARVQLALGQIPAARSTVAQALLDWPADTNLLALAAEIELAADQPASALDYLGRALYVDPAQQQALVLQTEAFLMLGDQSDAGTERQLQYYGLAVRSAQTLGLYYAGDPLGYLYLAKARIGEGNYALAETALNRIVVAQDALPLPVVREAQRALGDLYYKQGRLEEAKRTLERVSLTQAGEIDQVVTARLYEIAVRLGDYNDALTQLDALLFVDPTNNVYQLERARSLVELCTFYPDQLTCEYGDMLELLNDSFVNSLRNETQRADGYSYRAQARYWDTERRTAALGEAEQQLAYELALNDVTQALAVRESAVDHYYRGLILDELDRAAQALEEYQWVVFWSDFYSYPFRTEAFDERVAALFEQVGEIAGGTPRPTSQPGQGPATATPRGPTPTPTLSPTPTATATSTPPPAAPELP